MTDKIFIEHNTATMTVRDLQSTAETMKDLVNYMARVDHLEPEDDREEIAEHLLQFYNIMIRERYSVISAHTAHVEKRLAKQKGN